MSRYIGVLPLDRRQHPAEIVREIKCGDEIRIDGATWRVTQVIHEDDPEHFTAYAGPVNPRTNDVDYDRAITNLHAWRQEYARQHSGS